MTAEERIQLLQQELDRLSEDLSRSALQVQQLRQQIAALKSEKQASVSSVSMKEEPQVQRYHRPVGLEQFIGLNLMHVVGIVVLVIGISIGVKYAIDKDLIGPVSRIALAYAAGLLLFVLSMRLRKQYTHFSAILFSGSMASIYFTTYAACVYYQFIPFAVAFAMMVALTVYTVFMAISYDRSEIALIGMIGAYGIPFLISQNSDRADLFFAYILMINIGIVVLSFRKSWKLMGKLAMLITWSLLIGWIMLRYDPGDHFAIAIIFTTSFYLLFLVNALAFRVKRNMPLSYKELWLLLCNNIALLIAVCLVFFDVAWTESWAIAAGVLTTLTIVEALAASGLLPSERRLQQSLFVQAIVFLLLFILARFEGLTTTLLWVVVAGILFAVGILRRLPWVRLVSVVVMGLTLVKLAVIDSMSFTSVQKIIAFIVIGVLLLLFSFYYQRLRKRGTV